MIFIVFFNAYKIVLMLFFMRKRSLWLNFLNKLRCFSEVRTLVSLELTWHQDRFVNLVGGIMVIFVFNLTLKSDGPYELP